MSKVDKTTNSNGKMEGGITGKGFKKGKSGNPNGRPKGVQSIPDILRKIGDEEGTVDGVPKLEVVLRRVFNMALGFKDEKGTWHHPEAWAIRFIADRTEGKALERIETTYKEPIRLIELD